MIGSPVSVFKMVPKDDDEHTYVWHYQNQAQEGEYRFLANLVGQGIIYYKKSQISEQQEELPQRKICNNGWRPATS